MKNFLIFVLILFFFSCSTWRVNNCQQTRAAIDVGSGSTRVLIAKIDQCRGKINEVLFNDEQAIAYRETLVDGNALSPVTMEKGKILLTSYIAKAKEFHVDKVIAVGTEVFRRALNGESFVSELNRNLKLNMTIIDQQYEARLGYASVLSQLEIGENVVVWDVGGASTQIIARLNGEFRYYFPKYGSVAFKEFVIRDVQKRDPKKILSPNPLSLQNAKKAEQITVEALRTENIPDWLTKMLVDSKTRVFGIGGVHVYSIKNQIKNGRTNYADVEVGETLRKQLKKTDSQIGGDYAQTEVTNLVLIKSFLKALNIRSVFPVKVSLAQGLMFN